MSASNGQRARFHRNRKRKILMRMKLRDVMLTLKNKPAGGESTEAPAPRPRRKAGPALEAK